MRSVVFAVAVGCAALSYTVPAAAAEYLNFGGVSYHYERDLHFNEFNYGIGYERDIQDNFSWSSGVYKNSLRRASIYLLWNYYPFQFSESWRAGVTAGFSTGYHHSAVIAEAAPTIEWRGERWALQGYLIPTIKPYVDGAAVLQVKYRFQ